MGAGSEDFVAFERAGPRKRVATARDALERLRSTLWSWHSHAMIVAWHECE